MTSYLSRLRRRFIPTGGLPGGLARTPVLAARWPGSLGLEVEGATGASPIDQETAAVRRRQFLQPAAVMPLLTGPLRAGAEDRRAPVIDTHLHCFAGKGDPRFPYHPRGPYQPAEPAAPEHLLRCMAEAEVDSAVVVHPEPYQDDHRYLEHCLKVSEGKLKGTCLFFADRPGSLDEMPELVK